MNEKLLYLLRLGKRNQAQLIDRYRANYGEISKSKASVSLKALAAEGLIERVGTSRDFILTSAGRSIIEGAAE